MEIYRHSQFRKDFKKLLKSGFRIKERIAIFEEILIILSKGEKLPVKYRDHTLTGKWENYRDCHIEPDLVLVYKASQSKIDLMRICSHSELFG